jgi:hypothetical protein
MAEGEGPALFTQNDTGEYVEYTPPSFHETLPEGLRDSEHLKNISDNAQLAENYANLIKDQPVVPGDSSGYSFDFPDDFNLDADTFSSIKEKALELGITQKTFQGLMEFEVERERVAEETYRNTVARNREAAENQLKTEWGDNYDSKRDSAVKFLDRFQDENFRTFLEETKFGDNPTVIRFFANLAEKISEDAFINPGSRPPTGEQRRGEGGEPMLDFPSMR